ncbi:MAG: SprT family zinc-dependent metalloprotease [Burkholderiaceae bacterium]
MQRLLQFTLDLFDPDPAPVPAAAPEMAAAPAVPAPPAVPLSEVLDPGASRHPDASREIMLGGIVVAYEFRRAKRRTIGFVVGAEGLSVRAPKWVPLPEVDKALREKETWILRKLEETRERAGRLKAATVEWKDGASFPFLGEQVIVVLDPRQDFSGANAELRTDEGAANLTLAGVPRLTLHVGLPNHAGAAQIRDVVQAWLMRQAKRHFTGRLEHFAPQLRVNWTKLSLSSAGTRWGSASADGAIRLNWRLVHFKPSVIDYVVVHELSHLRVMDHSPRFWETVASIVPDYAELRGQLKDEALPQW